MSLPQSVSWADGSAVAPSSDGSTGGRQPGPAVTLAQDLTRIPLRLALGPRLVIMVVLAALLAGGVVGTVAAQTSRDALHAQILASNLATADLAAQYVSQYVDTVERAVRI